MHTTIDIDDSLVKAAQEATGLKTKKAVVEAGLRLLIRRGEQVAAIQALKGSADWEGEPRHRDEER